MINKELIELMGRMRIYTPGERLEMFLEAARVTGLTELEVAIELYQEDYANRITAEDYAGAQEESIKAQFGKIG